ncbi:MAG: hypothetical protein G3M78_08250 [Candidatus Nitrohelix vancouverensis]|uniref:RiboL-PSP-HEPN domain-containing protein n=1 Tax=Candidatus Nitrohelix vancouverensis TaxID=2705534 RepID=A0A7T0C2J5_9BACT|nr:MAG: hypothetical protein G3M78_08250 [Candidatus Nitrohelix vancouverensis]
MYNDGVEQELARCEDEIVLLGRKIDELGVTNSLVPYLTKYAIIRGCGAIEQAFKSIIVDYCIVNCNVQVINYLENKISRSSMNPSYENICGLLKELDDNWHRRFKNEVNGHSNANLKTSLSSLVQLRNEFAHGGNPTASIQDVSTYFSDSRVIIYKLDTVIRTL